MKTIQQLLTEKLKINKTYKIHKDIKFIPNDKKELQNIILDKVKNEGNETDLSDIDTSKIKDMSYLFNHKDLKNFNGNGLDVWDVSNVKDFNAMFKDCIKLEILDLSDWDVSNAKDMSDMFYYCRSLKSIGDVSRWNIEKVKFMVNMFNNCINLKCDLSNWNFYKNCQMAYITDHAPNVKLTK